MNRVIVTEVPKEATLVKPFELKPTVLESKQVWDAEAKAYKKEDTERPWPLDPNLARLIGEAKSLARGLSIRLENSVLILLNPPEIAWYATNQGVDIHYLYPYHYLSKRWEA